MCLIILFASISDFFYTCIINTLLQILFRDTFKYKMVYLALLGYLVLMCSEVSYTSVGHIAHFNYRFINSVMFRWIAHFLWYVTDEKQQNEHRNQTTRTSVHLQTATFLQFTFKGLQIYKGNCSWQTVGFCECYLTMHDAMSRARCTQ